MAAEKAIYWMAVGVLVLGLCNALSQNQYSIRGVADRSRVAAHQLSTELVRTAGIILMHDKIQSEPNHAEADCARVRMDATVGDFNTELPLGARSEAIKALIYITRGKHDFAPRAPRELVEAASGSSVL